jgi:hypothetical protein
MTSNNLVVIAGGKEVLWRKHILNLPAQAPLLDTEALLTDAQEVREEIGPRQVYGE